MTRLTLTTLPSRSALACFALAGLVACGSSEPTTPAERLARGRELVQQMSAKLAATTHATATTTEVRDVVRGSGAKEPVPGSGVYTLRRPDRFHVKMAGGRDIEGWYDGKKVTLAAHKEKVFAQAEMPETIDRTLDALSERYDMALPLADLFHSSPEKALLSDTTTGGYAGVENVGDTPCAHLVFHDVGVDWELWLPVQGDPLPKRWKVVQTARRGQPVVDVTFTKWDLTTPVNDAMFVPSLPAEYEGIAILQRAAAVKNTAEK
jgi:hypothetical protein